MRLVIPIPLGKRFHNSKMQIFYLIKTKPGQNELLHQLIDYLML